MPDMNSILGLGQDVFFEGKLYRISDDLEFGVQANFERWLKSQAMRESQEATAGNPDLQEKMCRIFMADSLAGAYRLEGSIARQALMNNPEASVKLLHLLLEDGALKAPKEQQHEITEQLARRMLRDKEVGPWVKAVCLVALGLDPTNALIIGTGIVMTRAEFQQTQQMSSSRKDLRQEISKRLSGSSSESALNYLLNYIDSVGGESAGSSVNNQTKEP